MYIGCLIFKTKISRMKRNYSKKDIKFPRCRKRKISFLKMRDSANFRRKQEMCY